MDVSFLHFARYQSALCFASSSPCYKRRASTSFDHIDSARNLGAPGLSLELDLICSARFIERTRETRLCRTNRLFFFFFRSAKCRRATFRRFNRRRMHYTLHLQIVVNALYSFSPKAHWRRSVRTYYSSVIEAIAALGESLSLVEKQAGHSERVRSKWNARAGYRRPTAIGQSF